jgi:hypothetical protein
MPTNTLRYVNLPNGSSFNPPLASITVNGQDIITYLAGTRPRCPFGTRVIIKVNNTIMGTGRYTVLQIFSETPHDNKACITTMYQENAHGTISNSPGRLDVTAPVIPPLPARIVGPTHYTTEERVDHTNLDTITIDDSNAHDLDDALTVDVERRILYVHIVDLVGGGISAEDEDRLKVRTATLYVKDNVRPLLTQATADRLTLISTGHEKNVITVKMLINAIGGVSHYAIYPSTIQSIRRLSYDDVATNLITPTNNSIGRTLEFLDTLATMSGYTKATLVPDTGLFTGYKPALRVVRPTPLERAKNLVQIAMNWANITVASHLRTRGVRIPNLLNTPTAFISELFRGTAGVVAGVVNAAGRIQMISRVVRGTIYDSNRRRHDNIDVPDYTHFTSPMRRDADATVHKILAGQFDDALLDARVARMNHRESVHESLQDLSARWRWLSGVARQYTVKIVSLHTNPGTRTIAGVTWSYNDRNIKHDITNYIPIGNITETPGNPIRRNNTAQLTIGNVNMPACTYDSHLTT